MQEIKNTAILGAGAMGAYFASTFFDTRGLSTKLIAKGERQKRLEKNGLVVNNKPYLIPVLNPENSDEKADLIIVALKHHHMKEALQGLENIVHDSTTFISVMNGLESEEYIGSIYGMDKVLYAISVAIDAVREDNRVRFSKPGKHFFGEARNNKLSERVLRVQEAFDKAGIVHEIPQDMMRILWWKFMINAGMNQASAVMRAPYGVFQKSAQAQALMETLMREVITLANAMGVDLTEKDIEDWYSFLKILSPEGKTSTLQDIEAGRKTEIELFGKKISELGEIHGVPTPVNKTMYQIISVLEQKFQ